MRINEGIIKDLDGSSRTRRILRVRNGVDREIIISLGASQSGGCRKILTGDFIGVVE